MQQISDVTAGATFPERSLLFAFGCRMMDEDAPSLAGVVTNTGCARSLCASPLRSSVLHEPGRIATAKNCVRILSASSQSRSPVRVASREKPLRMAEGTERVRRKGKTGNFWEKDLPEARSRKTLTERSTSFLRFRRQTSSLCMVNNKIG